MSPSKQQASSIRLDKKQAIRDAALYLFAEKGYELTSVDAIAKRAGVSKGLIYTYFENKDALLHDIITSYMERVSRGINAVIQEIVDPYDQLEKATDWLFEDVQQNHVEWKIYAIIMTPIAFVP